MTVAVIVAGGSGKRMGADLKKQYLSVGGMPVLSRTLKGFDKSERVRRILLVVPEIDLPYVREHVTGAIPLVKEVTLVAGGAERQASVYNGIRAAGELYRGAEERLVVIHDGVRPFAEPSLIDRVIDAAQVHGAAISAIPAVDTLKRVGASGEIEGTVDREGIWLAQTPQAFSYDLLRKLHEKALDQGFSGTDDASLVERFGGRVVVVPGSRMNIKITTPEDLLLSEAFLASGAV